MSEYLEIMSDPAHMAAEFTFTLIFDVLIVGIIWPLICRAIKREHLKIDREHGVKHERG